MILNPCDDPVVDGVEIWQLSSRPLLRSRAFLNFYKTVLKGRRGTSQVIFVANARSMYCCSSSCGVDICPLCSCRRNDPKDNALTIPLPKLHTFYSFERIPVRVHELSNLKISVRCCNDFRWCYCIRLFYGPLHPFRTKVPTLWSLYRDQDGTLSILMERFAHFYAAPSFTPVCRPIILPRLCPRRRLYSLLSWYLGDCCTGITSAKLSSY